MNTPSGLATADNAPDGLGGWLIVSSRLRLCPASELKPIPRPLYARPMLQIIAFVACFRIRPSLPLLATEQRLSELTACQVSRISTASVFLFETSGHSDCVVVFPSATLTALNSPLGVSSYDSNGTFYVSDTLNRVVRRIFPNGTAQIVAGILGSAGNSVSQLNFPRALSLIGDDVIIADSGSHAVRILYANNTMSTLFGVVGSSGFTGDGGIGGSWWG
jgi:hypothetical protein